MIKRRLLTLLTAVIAAAAILSALAVPSFAARKLGDIDGDGFITSADARSALRASVKLDVLTDEQAMAADVDVDTFVTSGDARLILRASVKLETLPDRYVGEPTEATPTDATPTDVTPTDATPTDVPPTDATPTDTTPTDVTPTDATPTDVTPTDATPTDVTPTDATPTDATPTDATPTDATPTDATPTDATPTDATPTDATPTDPEKPDRPERTDFIMPEKDNEFDILRSGNYYFVGKTVDDSGKSDLEIAKTKNTIYLGAKFGKTRIAVLTIGTKSYLVNPAKDLYLDLNTATMKAELRALGLDIESFSAKNSFDFSFFPALENATRSEKVPGDDSYVKYVFEVKDGVINVTMSGKKLISLESTRAGSTYRIDFTSVSANVPSKKCELKNLNNAVLQTVFVGSLL